MKTNEGQTQKKVEKVTSFEALIFSNPGSPIAPVYKRVFDSSRNKNIVKKVSETNLYEFIQASKSQTDLAALEKRMIATGEIPAMDPSMNADGVDFTVYPKDIHEVYSMVNDIENNYSKLPQSVQEIFGSKEAYLKSVVDGTMQSVLINALNKKVPGDTPTPEGENK